jgi:hypothetical protein
MRALFGALTAFFDEHQRCGELDGGRGDGYIWLRCSCGAQIAHPTGAPAPAPADIPKQPIARMPDEASYPSPGTSCLEGKGRQQ